MIMHGHWAHCSGSGSGRRKIVRSSSDVGKNNSRSNKQLKISPSFSDWQYQQHNNNSNSSNRRPTIGRSISFGGRASQSVSQSLSQAQQQQHHGSYVYTATGAGMLGPFSAEQAANRASQPSPFTTWDEMARETHNISQRQSKGKARAETSQQLSQSKRSSRWLYLINKMIGKKALDLDPILCTIHSIHLDSSDFYWAEFFRAKMINSLPNFKQICFHFQLDVFNSIYLQSKFLTHI